MIKIYVLDPVTLKKNITKTRADSQGHKKWKIVKKICILHKVLLSNVK